jgi:hypothetical protein
MNDAALSLIDVDRLELRATVLLDDLDRGAANPWGVAWSEAGAVLGIAHSGTHELSLICALQSSAVAELCFVSSRGAGGRTELGSA